MEYKSINFISKYLLDIVNKDCKKIIEKIAIDYKLDEAELKKKYLDPIVNDKEPSKNNILKQIQIQDEKKTGNVIVEKLPMKNNKDIINSVLDENIRCVALIRTGKRCKRTKKGDTDYCNIHLKKLNIKE